MALQIKYKNDYKLVHKYLCNDKEAGHELYAGIYKALKCFIYKHKFTKHLSIEEKEEIFSNTLDTSVKKLQYYNGKSSFLTFVCGIANNKILEKIKDNKRDINNNEKIVTVIKATRINKEPLSILIDKEILETIAKAKKMLSPKQKMIIKYREDNLSVKEISNITNLSESAIRSLYRRAIVAIKKNFEKIYNSSD